MYLEVVAVLIGDVDGIELHPENELIIALHEVVVDANALPRHREEISSLGHLPHQEEEVIVL